MPIFSRRRRACPRPWLASPGTTRGSDDQIDDLLARVRTPESREDVDKIRDLGTLLLGVLVRHRQRGSDLVYEAYELDLGGET